MAAAASWTKQTSPAPEYLGAGRHLAKPICQAQAGGFPLGYWTDDGSTRKGAHGHEDAHFMLVTSGCYETLARPDAVSTDALLIFNPAGTYHCDRLVEGGAFFTMTIPPDCWDTLDRLAIPDRPVEIGSRAAHMLARHALREAAHWAGDSALVAEALCWELAASFETADSEGKRPAWLGRACAYLCEHAAQPVGLGRLSGELGVHPVHLTRTFRRFLRCTPGEYLRAWRLDRAATMLTQGGPSLVQIAFETGFSDQSHLNRHFARAYGIAPGQYRKLTRN
jgi:AraC family transcriptional regulator